MRKRLSGILAAVILVLSLGIPAASASTTHAANPTRITHLFRVRIAATSQFLAALKQAREAGRGVRTDDPTGVCWSGTSFCWRDMPSGAIDMWNRDISGDGRQQWDVIYEGTTLTTGCPVGPTQGVFAFLGYNGYYASAGYFSDGVYWVGDGTSYDFWAWNGTTGELANCADTRNNGVLYEIPAASWSEGSQLYTWPAPANWTPFEQIHVS